MSISDLSRGQPGIDLGEEGRLESVRVAPGKASLTGRLHVSRKAADNAPSVLGRSWIDVPRGGGGGDPFDFSFAQANEDSGAPLDAGLGARFAATTGHDVSGVRVHTGPASDASANAIGARAYALGQDIHFAAGEYQPGTRSGDHLIAHEVAHTVQQRGGAAAAPQTKLTVSDPADAAEHEADAVADAVVTGTPMVGLSALLAPRPMTIARRAREDAPQMDAPPGGGGGGAAGAGGAPGAEGATTGEAAEFSVEHAGQEEIEGTEPVAPPHDLEGGKAELAAQGAALPEDGGAAEAAGGITPDEGGGPGGEPEAPPSPEVAAAIEGAQADTREAIAEAEGESSGYQAEMAEKRGQFENEQNALMIEKLKSMSPADKRTTLVEMGWDLKEVKKLKDAELDAIIEGTIAAENRKAKIMGMTPEELAGLSAGAKIQHLVDLGIDKEDLDKVGEAKACSAFDQIMRVAHVPGQHKVKIKVKGGLFGKSWVVTISCDAEGNTDIQAKKEGGFLSKLWGWVKAALPIILVVLGPLTGGASLIVLAVYQAAMAIKNGDWLGAIMAVAGAVSGVGAFMAARGALAAASTMAKIASIANKVKQVAQAAQAAMLAAKAKNPGSLLAALASGAATFATFASNAASKFAQTMTKWSERLKKWAAIVQGGQKVAQGIRTGDPIGAIGGAFDTAVGIVGAKTETGKNLQRASNITNFVNAGRNALKSDPPNYGAVAEAAFGIAGQLEDDRRIEDAARIVGAANRLKGAWDQRGSNPAALAEAALELAQAIQIAKYDADNEEKKDADGKPLPDSEREAIIGRYTTATNVVRSAGALIAAASAKPRPNYAAALEAATQLVADLTDNKKLDAAADITAKLNRWTAAVNSKDDRAIMEAAVALGESINGLADVIRQEREAAKAAAQANLPEGQSLPEDGGEIPRFETSIDVVGTAPPVDTIPPELDTSLDLPAGPEVAPAPPVGAPRSSTPGANYTVIPGDTLSGIASRFDVTVNRLRALNPQIVSDRIYVQQRLFVPGADTLLTPSVTTDETFRIDPSVVAGQRAEAVQRALVVVNTINAQIKSWNEQNSLGADFYVYVRELGGEVDFLDRMLDRPTSTVEGINSQIRYVNERFQRVTALYGDRQGTKERILDGSIFALEFVKDGAGVVLEALDRSRIISAGYKGVIAAIEEYSEGGSGSAIAIRAVLATVIERMPDGGQNVLKSAVIEGFREAAEEINKFMADLTRDPNMSDEAKRQLKAEALAKIPTLFAMGAVKGRLDAINESALARNLKKVMDEGLFDLVKKALDKAIN